MLMKFKITLILFTDFFFGQIQTRQVGSIYLFLGTCNLMAISEGGGKRGGDEASMHCTFKWNVTRPSNFITGLIL